MGYHEICSVSDLYVILQVALLVRRVYAREVHAVEAAVLLCFVPVGLKKARCTVQIESYDNHIITKNSLL